MEKNRSIPRILVVEDDALVREMIVDILLDAGFATDEAACAEEALRSLVLRPVDAVITDVDMPGALDGIGLARHIGTQWPKLGVIVISGGSRAAAALPKFARFLAKPFATARLIDAVVAQIDQQPHLAS